MQVADPHPLRGEIAGLMAARGLGRGCYSRMLDYTIELFEGQGLGTDYYGYHNINHELEVTYVALLASGQGAVRISDDDARYVYAAALFHDFDPQKDVDKPHEESVIRFVSMDRKLGGLMAEAGIDIEIVKALILRTTYPWGGEGRARAEAQIAECFGRSETARNDPQYRQHVMEMGRYLSVVDRVSGYALGDFGKAMEMAKMNAHALGWPPTRIVRASVAYFEELLDAESEMTGGILGALPKGMRRNFFGTVLAFMGLRRQEISIQADRAYENLKLVPTIEPMSTRMDPAFATALYEIFLELPTPLQFGREGFAEAVADPGVIINTLRINDREGEVVGFAKGGPLEGYALRPEINDENRGLGNTVFLEPLALKMGYWGLGGGSEMRHMFIMQAHSRKYRFLTSFALRDVIRARMGREEAEFVTLFDPERWDYYRIRI